MTLAVVSGGLGVPVAGSQVTADNICSNPPTFWQDAPWGAGLIAVPRHTSQGVVRFVAARTTEIVTIQFTTPPSPGAPDYYFAVFQDGVYLSSFQATPDGVSYTPQTKTITGLTAGATIDIVEPSQGPVTVTPGSAVVGGYVVALTYSTAVRVSPTRMLTFGDGNSYSGGYGSSAPNCVNGFVGRMRAAYPGGFPSTAVRQWSSNGFLVFSDSTHETVAIQSQAALDLARGTSNEIIFVANERNDWFYNSGTDVQVGTRVAAICDAIHAGNASAKILLAATWLTLSEGANSLGLTLPQYRAALIGAASGRPYVTTLDLSNPAVMPNWNTATCLSDDSHPNDLGHSQVATVTGVNLPLGPI